MLSQKILGLLGVWTGPTKADFSRCSAPQVIFLEKRVSELERDTVANGEQHSRLRQENLQLVHR